MKAVPIRPSGRVSPSAIECVRLALGVGGALTALAWAGAVQAQHDITLRTALLDALDHAR